MKIAPISMKTARPMPTAVTAFMRFREVRWRRGRDACCAARSGPRATTSSGVSATTRFVPVVRCTTVSGWASMVTIRSGLRWKGSGSARGGAAGSSSRPLALEVDQVAEHLVRRRDDTRVRLEAALRRDELGELGGQVDVRHLDDAGDGAAEAGACRACRRRRRGPRGPRPAVTRQRFVEARSRPPSLANFASVRKPALSRGAAGLGDVGDLAGGRRRSCWRRRSGPSGRRDAPSLVCRAGSRRSG